MSAALWFRNCSPVIFDPLKIFYIKKCDFSNSQLNQSLSTTAGGHSSDEIHRAVYELTLHIIWQEEYLVTASNDCLPSSEMDGDMKARCCGFEYGGNGRNQQVVV